MKKPNLAVLGATGVVGREILSILVENDVPFENIKFLASSKSAGKKIEFKGKEYTIEEATPDSFEGVNIVLASAGGSTSLALAKEAVKRGCVYIDNSSAFRMEKDVPLVIAGVNHDDLKKHQGIVANPNCSTSQLMLVLKPLHDYAKIKRLIVSTYQAVSGAGLAAINELRDSTEASLKGEKFENKKFVKDIAFNVIPQIDVFCDNGYTKEEMKIKNETAKILSENIKVSATCVRVPVKYGHAVSAYLTFSQHVSASDAIKTLASAKNVALCNVPTPKNSVGNDGVTVGRIREDGDGLWLFITADNLRKGAATNAVQIIELLEE